MKSKKNTSTKKAEEYITYVIASKFKGRDVLKKESPGIVEHDNKDLVIAQEIYKDLKKKCIEYKNGSLDAKTISKFCFNVMYSKYSPRVVSKIIADEIYDALDYISELSFNKEK